MPPRRTRIAAVLPCLLLAVPALHAQDADEAQTLESVQVTAVRAVTATKTDTPLTAAPQAVSVVPAALYADRGALNVQETLRYTAGVTAEAYGLDTRGDAITVRGLDPVLYQDGMRKVFNYSPLPRTDVNTLERIEVLRGPSSVLYGQGASGGIVNSISKRPQFNRAGRATLQYGSYNRKQGTLDLTGPLGTSDHLAGRVTAVLRKSGMQTEQLDDDRVLLQPSIIWQPTDRTQVTFIGLVQRDHTGSSLQFLPRVATLQGHGARRVGLSTFLGDAGQDKLNARQASATVLIEHQASDAVTLRSNTRYLGASTVFQQIYPDVYSNPDDPFIDADKRLLNRTAYGIEASIHTLTTDNSAQFDFDTGAFEHRFLVGVDYTDFRQRSLSANGQVSPIDLYNPVSTGVVFPAFVRDPAQRNTQLGVYAQDQIRYADRVSLVVGARHDRARSSTSGAKREQDEATTIRVGLIGEVAPSWSPYISYSESFLPVAGLDFHGHAFTPVRGSQYEAGLKWQPVREALVTANVYRITERNRPTNDPDNLLNVIQTGEIRSRGVELEGSYALPDDFVATAAYSINDAEVTRSTFAPEVGRQLSDTPRHQASLWLEKDLAAGGDAHWRLGLGVRHVGSTRSIGDTGTLRTPGYTLADALVSYERRAWSLSVNVTNLFDKQYFAPCRIFGDCFTGNGRNVIGTLAFKL